MKQAARGMVTVMNKSSSTNSSSSSSSSNPGGGGASSSMKKVTVPMFTLNKVVLKADDKDKSPKR